MEVRRRKWVCVLETRGRRDGLKERVAEIVLRTSSGEAQAAVHIKTKIKHHMLAFLILK